MRVPDAAAEASKSKKLDEKEKKPKGPFINLISRSEAKRSSCNKIGRRNTGIRHLRVCASPTKPPPDFTGSVSFFSPPRTTHRKNRDPHG
jgi:hypothetical protein